MFWLDEAEPEYGPYDYDLFRYQAGPALEISNYYPVLYARTFWDGNDRQRPETGNESDTLCGGREARNTGRWSGREMYTHHSGRWKEQVQAGDKYGKICRNCVVGKPISVDFRRLSGG